MEFEIPLLAVLLDEVGILMVVDELVEGDDIGMVETFHHFDLGVVGGTSWVVLGS